MLEALKHQTTMTSIECLDPREFEELLSELETDDEKTDAIIIRCYRDLEWFCNYYFPHYCTHEFCEFHVDYFKNHDPTQRRRRRVRAAPRGSAKSVFATVIQTIHSICYQYEHYTVLFSNTSPQVKAKLKDIRAEILTNELLQSDFGLCFPVKNPGATEFVVHAGFGEDIFKAKFSGFGWRAEVRGLRFGTKRPSSVICDDVEHSTEVFNEEIRNKDLAHYSEVISKIGDENTNQDFVGTVLHRDSLLKKLCRNPAYDSKTYKSIIQWPAEEPWDDWRKIYTDLDNKNRKYEADIFYKKNEEALTKGVKVLWPEKEPILFLMQEMVEIGKRAFMKEKQNEPLGADDKVFETMLWYKEVPDGLHILHNDIIIPWEKLVNNCKGTLDPAGGQDPVKKGKLGDFASILTGYSLPTLTADDDNPEDQFGRLFVHECWLSRVPPTKQIKSIFDHHERYNYQKFGVETNMYRNMMMPNIGDEKERRQKKGNTEILLEFYDIENTENKTARITNIEPKVSNGHMLFNVALSLEFKNQMEEFPHADHDDGPDTLHMLWGMHTNRYRAFAFSAPLMKG